jgi:hypothetical protein
MFGGADPAIPNLVPSDIEFRRNYVFTPPSWSGVWTKKNLFETKNASRVLIEGNVFDGSWSDGQTGYAILLKSVNQSGRCTWCVSKDITIRYNVIRNAGAGINMLAKSGSYPTTSQTQRILIEHNLLENINVGVFRGDGSMFQVLNNVLDLTIRNNTASTSGSQKVLLTLGPKPAASNLEFGQNVFTPGRYGIYSSGFGSGESAFGAAIGQTKVGRYVVIGPSKPGYPNATFVNSLADGLNTGLGANSVRISQLTTNVVIP